MLAAVSGRVLARSFHAVLNVGIEMIKQALGSGDVNNPELTWNRMELSVMLEHVQAHVAPTDVDPGAGLQWLPKISRISSKVKHTGALLEQVFLPCDMYFRYTLHKAGTTDLEVFLFMIVMCRCGRKGSRVDWVEKAFFGYIFFFNFIRFTKCNPNLPIFK